ncbi:hypothetical protein AMS68_005596 [Peltaster fructicola]|uniref:WW domain-containing protein n=1 Tax=Peltaster fructicola TaxID=286661 RepID=A0A6H0XZN5_9PEZI|nr:hypothetical protein AMS68_005596 [Peltaster fructicola]
MVDLHHRSDPEELFLQPDSYSDGSQQPATGSTPKPLRINKPATTSDQPKQQWAAYNIPPSSSAAMYGAPLSPPPNKPLPYPEERDRRQGSGSQAGGRATPIGGQAEPAQGQRQSDMSSESSSRRRAHFDGNDPNRPSASFSTAPAPTPRGRPSYPESPGGPEPPEKDDAADATASGDTSFQQQFYPPPLGSTAPATHQLLIPNPAGVNRLSSTASTSTTRASRGSPPPPETPIDPHGGPTSGLGDIEARYAASGIPGTSTLNEMQAQSAAAAARRAQYSNSPARTPALAQPVPKIATTNANGRRWSPTEAPALSPHGPPIVFQGVEEVNSRGSHVPSQAGSTAGSVAGSTASSGAGSSSSGRSRQQAYQRPPEPAGSPDLLQGDMARMNVHDEPPPAYSPPVGGAAMPNEKGRPQSPAVSAASSGSKLADPNVSRHPAFANDAHTPSTSVTPQAGRAHPAIAPINTTHANMASPVPSAPGPISPPPLPEGWIAHLDPNSGQYYYIHLPTQATQWEFPKGPTPLSLQEPMSPIGGVNPLASPIGSMYKQPLQSPGFGPVLQTANYDSRNSIFSLNSIASPTAAGFTGPPPSTGVDMYKVAPANGVYFGPYLRYTNMDLERGLWLGSIMLITDAAQPPTIHIHQSVDLSPNPRQLKANHIHTHQRWVFYRYDVDLRMEEDRMSQWTYAITSHLGCTRYEFIVAGRHEQTWRWVAHSGNDFEISVNANERAKLGGVGLMWKDVLQKHTECGGFHAQVGLGGQISADRLWKDLPAMRQWTQISGKDNRKNAPWNAQLEEDVVHAYFHYYTSHFDQPAVREAFAQIPHVCCLDDQDIFDGYGSYPEYMQQSNMVKNIGRIGIDMYLLFQHHTNTEILRNVSNDIDLFTITGTGWHFLKYFGPSVVLVGPDTRSERNQRQVMAGPTYQGIFPKVAMLPPSVQHCIWLFPVPIVYPRLENIESIANTVATGKKVVTGGFNALGKIAGGVAGVVGAKGVVNQGFEGVKKAMGKSGLMQGVLSPFGEIDMLDELRDMWTHDSKDLERTYIIRTLQGIAHNKSIRMTFLSGSVNASGAGLVHDPSRPSDHKTMYQLITAPIVNAPAPGYVIRMLHTNKTLYVPQNGHRSNTKGDMHATDTKEDMMEIFAQDTNGAPREHKRLMGRRNYLACVAFDPEVVQGAFGTTTPSLGKGPMEASRLSLAADFMVQGDNSYGQVMKYGPIIIPSLEYGR